jgi:effector-binding domain-containing protein
MTPLAVRLADTPPTSLAVVRRVVRRADLHRVVPECCGLVWNAMRAQQASAGRHVAVYWDAAITVEIGVEALGPFAEQGELKRSATPSGLVASAAFFGPYQGLGSAHAAIHDWVRAHGRRLAGPSWETYGHWQDAWNADPSLIRTDVSYLVSAD